MGVEVDYQVAAPTELRTPNWHRAKIAQQRVRMEGWRQRRMSSKKTTRLEAKIYLTQIGLLMEGLGHVASIAPSVARGDRMGFQSWLCPVWGFWA
jgi:hypothetical protein